jgi:hypothetical protein
VPESLLPPTQAGNTSAIAQAMSAPKREEEDRGTREFFVMALRTPRPKITSCSTRASKRNDTPIYLSQDRQITNYFQIIEIIFRK